MSWVGVHHRWIHLQSPTNPGSKGMLLASSRLFCIEGMLGILAILLGLLLPHPLRSQLISTR